jgi:methyl-accepting chemotaxis protein
MLKRFFGGGQSTESAVASAPAAPVITDSEAAAGINIKIAMDAHVRWRHRLESHVQGTSQENLQLAVVAADDQCLLGKWIHGEAKHKYGHLDLFSELVEVHAQFHQYAGEVLSAAAAGKHEEALGLLQSGAYPRCSAKVKHLLAKLYVEVLCVDNPVRGHVDPHPPASHG